MTRNTIQDMIQANMNQSTRKSTIQENTSPGSTNQLVNMSLENTSPLESMIQESTKLGNMSLLGSMNLENTIRASTIITLENRTTMQLVIRVTTIAAAAEAITLARGTRNTTTNQLKLVILKIPAMETKLVRRWSIPWEK